MCVCVFQKGKIGFKPCRPSLLCWLLPAISFEIKMADEPMLFVGNLPPVQAEDIRRWLEDHEVRVAHVGTSEDEAKIRMREKGVYVKRRERD